MDYPQDLLYTDKHEWLREAGDGVYRVGITDYAQDALGDVVFVTLPAVGETFSRDDAAGEVESTKSVSDVYSPLSGEITAVNDALDATPENVNSDPYGEGWIFEIKVSESSEVEDLLDAEAYTATLD
ncbi:MULTISPECIES: glycine cleavage system protein GcvH [Kytococcus]|uniref:Glycine cleavage system H protein n=1 Tax=Kytococcus schroeteri TaxID=138300 RepID=A0A2I1PDQ2_9MICO|nr:MULTISPECIES: glycine cleavage system protein GcvH [Kytococcus]OFS11013.1 glycine cleavage system protein H [Kytococcus sp. HMSC28H12]PKZ42734.1 glycine cleavage system protein H [Kytococcus schroeteri]